MRTDRKRLRSLTKNLLLYKKGMRMNYDDGDKLPGLPEAEDRIAMKELSVSPRASGPSHPRRRTTLLRDHARSRAKKSKLEFDLSREWVVNELNRGTCAVTGIPFDLNVGHGSDVHNKYAPTIDRINPGRGYTKDNCQVVIYAYNTAKGQWSHEDVMTMARTLAARELGLCL